MNETNPAVWDGGDPRDSQWTRGAAAGHEEIFHHRSNCGFGSGPSATYSCANDVYNLQLQQLRMYENQRMGLQLQHTLPFASHDTSNARAGPQSHYHSGYAYNPAMR
jgi:hypothetical protein